MCRSIGWETASLHREEKMRRRSVFPSQYGGFGRQPVERVVEFDDVEVFRVIFQMPGSRKVGRVEATFPVGIMPTGCADVNAGGHRRLNGSRLQAGHTWYKRARPAAPNAH
jgi:hypothetical protein